MQTSGSRRKTRTPSVDPSVPARGGWRKHGWHLASIWALLLMAYSNSFQAGLVFDNSTVIGQDPRIRQATLQNTTAILKGGYRYVDVNDALYRPLTTLSFQVNYAILGNDLRPASYHWFNLLLHGVNVALVYALGTTIF